MTTKQRNRCSLLKVEHTECETVLFDLVRTLWKGCIQNILDLEKQKEIIRPILLSFST